MKIDLSGKTALVTGGAQGLGKGFTESLAGAGARVVFTSRSEERLRLLSADLDQRQLKNMPINIDLSSESGVAELMKKLTYLNLDIDILVNNIGHTMEIKSPLESINRWKEVMDLNFFLHVDLTNHLLPNMKEKGWGRIVNITSIAGLEVSGPAPFNAAKAALTSYTRSVGRLLAIEDSGIVMTAVAPGIVITEGGHWDNMLKHDPNHAKKYLEERAALKRFGTVSEITGIVTFLCSELASFFHGSIIQADGGQSRSYMPHTYLV